MWELHYRGLPTRHIEINKNEKKREISADWRKNKKAEKSEDARRILAKQGIGGKKIASQRGPKR